MKHLRVFSDDYLSQPNTTIPFTRENIYTDYIINDDVVYPHVVVVGDLQTKITVQFKETIECQFQEENDYGSIIYIHATLVLDSISGDWDPDNNDCPTAHYKIQPSLDFYDEEFNHYYTTTDATEAEKYGLPFDQIIDYYIYDYMWDSSLEFAPTDPDEISILWMFSFANEYKNFNEATYLTNGYGVDTDGTPLYDFAKLVQTQDCKVFYSQSANDIEEYIIPPLNEIWFTNDENGGGINISYFYEHFKSIALFNPDEDDIDNNISCATLNYNGEEYYRLQFKNISLASYHLNTGFEESDGYYTGDGFFDVDVHDYIDGGVNSMYKVILPQGMPAIGSRAFNNNVDLCSVKLPKSVTKLMNGVFSGCASLNEINLENITVIHNSVFNECTALPEVNLINVTGVGNSAFYGCTNLSSINSLENCVIIDDYAFYDCTNLCGSIDIGSKSQAPESLIGTRSFYNTNIETVTGYFITIQPEAFFNCNSLTSIDLSNTTLIDEYAFYGCTSLSNIGAYSLNNVCEFGCNSFYGCTNLQGYLYFGKNSMKSGGSGVTIPTGCFAHCISIARIFGYFDEIMDDAFIGCTSLERADLDMVGRIGDAFYGCDNLRRVFIGTTITTDIPYLEVGVFDYQVENPNTDFMICVEPGWGEQFKNATNWSNYADYIYESY